MKHFIQVLLVTILLCQSTRAAVVRVEPDKFEAILRQVKASKMLYVQVDPQKKAEHEDEGFSDDFLNRADATVNTLAHSNGGDEAAMIIFAVVGLVVIVAWIPYLPVLIHDMVANDDKNLKVHHMISAQWNPFTSDVPRNGSLAGFRYSFFEDRKDLERNLKMGFALESGYYLIKERERYEGGYWLAGPSIAVGAIESDSLMVKIDLMGGSSFDSDLGLISRAELSMNWLFHSKLSLGVSVGGLYMNVKESSDDLSFVTGINTGVVF